MKEIGEILSSLRKQIEGVERAMDERQITSSEIAAAAEFFQMKLMRVVKLAKADNMERSQYVVG